MGKVYVVLGEWSDYDSHSKWMVRGFSDEEHARSFMHECQIVADDLKAKLTASFAEYQAVARNTRQFKGQYPYPDGFTKEWKVFTKKYNDIFDSYKSELDPQCCVSCGDGTNYMIEELEIEIQV